MGISSMTSRLPYGTLELDYIMKKGVQKMSSNNIERMKKLIEEKKKLSAQQGPSDDKPNQKMGNYRKAFKSTKRGGFFDK